MTDILLKKSKKMPIRFSTKKDACRNYVYILQCRDNSLYTGWTNDIGKRLAAHNAGRGAKYTREEDRCIWYIWRFFPPEKKR